MHFLIFSFVICFLPIINAKSSSFTLHRSFQTHPINSPTPQTRISNVITGILEEETSNNNWISYNQFNPSGKKIRFTYTSSGSDIIDPFQLTIPHAEQDFEYFEVGSARTLPLFKIDDGTLTLINAYIHNVVLDDCSLIQITGQPSGSIAIVVINHCRFEEISLHFATDYNSISPTPCPTQCCVLLIKVPQYQKQSSITIIDCLFAHISAGKSDSDFRMTPQSDYAPVMITYNGYPQLMEEESNNNIEFIQTRFISTHGSHTGAIDIRGSIGSVKLDRVTFSKTVAELSTRFVSDAFYGNVMYVSGIHDLQYFASQFIVHCRSDSDSPKLAAQSSLDFGSDDYLIPDFQSSMVISESGSDSMGMGTEISPFSSIQTAVTMCNPKKAQFVEKQVDMVYYPISMNIKAGIYEESEIKIVSERITMKGEGIGNTTIQNKDSSCVLSIETDNKFCKMEIIGITFEQVNIGTLVGDNALMMIQYGEINIIQCSFKQMNSITPSNIPFIRNYCKNTILSQVSFSNSNFNSINSISSIEVVSGGGLRLEICQFINISSASVINVDLSDTFSDLILRDCKFNQCTNTLEGSIVVTNSMVNNPTISKVQQILISPFSTFTRCEFTSNIQNGGVNFLGNYIQIGFVQCVFDSTSTISYSEQWNNPNGNEIKSYSFGGCTGNASSESISISTTGSLYSSIIQAINQKTQGGQSLLTLQIGSGTWEDDGLMIGARSISMEGAGINETILMNKITTRIWLACIIGGKLAIQNAQLRQASANLFYGGLLLLRGDGIIDLTNVVIKQRELVLNQTSNTIYATAGNIIITNCSIEKASFKNDYLSSIHSATIYCEDKFGSLSITQTNISQQLTSFINPPTVEQIRDQNNIEYGGGAIVIQNAQRLKFEECYFIQNQGWRTGVINIQQMSKNWISLDNQQEFISDTFEIRRCVFESNFANKDKSISQISYKTDIGNDIIFDYEYSKTDILSNIIQTNSSSIIPKTGSIHKQFAMSVFDQTLNAKLTFEVAYVSLEGTNQQTNTSGQQRTPYQTIEYANFHISSSQRLLQHLYVFPGNFTENCIFIGGQNVSITGTAQGLTDPKEQFSAQLDFPGPTEIHNSILTNEDLIQVYDGAVTLHTLVIRIDNSDESFSYPFSAIAIQGSKASASIEQCAFRTVNNKLALDKDFLSLDRGGNLTIRSTSVQKIIENYRPVLYIVVSETSQVTLQYVNITSCEIFESSSGVIHLQYYTGGTVTLDQCQFRYNIVVTYNYQGYKPFSGAMFIQLCESSLSSSSRSGSEQQQQLESSRMLVLNNCSFDNNIGDCGGAVTISGTRTLLQEERLRFIRCFFENNRAGSIIFYYYMPYGSDIYFYIYGIACNI